MGIGKICAIVLFGINAVIGFYNAGAFANGKVETRKGNGQAVANGISGIIATVLAVALYLDW